MDNIRLLAESIIEPVLRRQKLRTFVSELSGDSLFVESVVSGAALIEAKNINTTSS